MKKKKATTSDKHVGTYSLDTDVLLSISKRGTNKSGIISESVRDLHELYMTVKVVELFAAEELTFMVNKLLALSFDKIRERIDKVAFVREIFGNVDNGTPANIAAKVSQLDQLGTYALLDELKIRLFNEQVQAREQMIALASKITPMKLHRRGRPPAAKTSRRAARGPAVAKANA